MAFHLTVRLFLKETPILIQLIIAQPSAVPIGTVS